MTTPIVLPWPLQSSLEVATRVLLEPDRPSLDFSQPAGEAALVSPTQFHGAYSEPAFAVHRRRHSCIMELAVPPAGLAPGFSTLAQQLRQLGEVRRQPPRLVARQPIWSRAMRRSNMSGIGEKRKCVVVLETTLTTELRHLRLGVTSNSGVTQLSMITRWDPDRRHTDSTRTSKAFAVFSPLPTSCSPHPAGHCSFQSERNRLSRVSLCQPIYGQPLLRCWHRMNRVLAEEVK